jgi:hypothetical protein
MFIPEKLKINLVNYFEKKALTNSIKKVSKAGVECG